MTVIWAVATCPLRTAVAVTCPSAGIGIWAVNGRGVPTIPIVAGTPLTLTEASGSLTVPVTASDVPETMAPSWGEVMANWSGLPPTTNRVTWAETLPLAFEATTVIKPLGGGTTDAKKWAGLDPLTEAGVPFTV